MTDRPGDTCPTCGVTDRSAMTHCSDGFHAPGETYWPTLTVDDRELIEGRARMLLQQLRACFRSDGAIQIIPFSLIETIDDELGEGGEDHAASPLVDEVLAKLDDRADTFSVKVATVIRRLRIEHRHIVAENSRLRPAADRLQSLLSDVERLSEAATKARDKFLHYEDLHRTKCTAEGDEKADRNREMADMLTAALIQTEVP